MPSGASLKKISSTRTTRGFEGITSSFAMIESSHTSTKTKWITGVI